MRSSSPGSPRSSADLVADTVIQQVDDQELVWRKATRRRQTIEIQARSYYLITVSKEVGSWRG